VRMDFNMWATITSPPSAWAGAVADEVRKFLKEGREVLVFDGGVCIGNLILQGDELKLNNLPDPEGKSRAYRGYYASSYVKDHRTLWRIGVFT